MILVWYIVIPAVAAPLAWLLGRSRPALARWTAVAGTAAPLALLVWQWAGEAGTLQEFRMFAFRRYVEYRPYFIMEAEVNARHLAEA